MKTVRGVSAAVQDFLGTADNLTSSVSQGMSAADRQRAAIRTLEMAHAHFMARIESNAPQASAANQRACEVQRQTESTASAIVDSLKAMESTRNFSTTAKHIIREIRDITDQTNLLALNASIEAAHAGSFGRGFAVLAEQIRQLARRTGEACEQITELMSRVEKTLSSGSAQLATAYEQCHRLVEDVRLLKSFSQGIKDEADLEIQDARSVAEVARDMAQSTEQFHHLMACMEKTADRLTAQSQQLRTSMHHLESLIGHRSEKHFDFEAIMELLSGRLLVSSDGPEDPHQLPQPSPGDPDPRRPKLPSASRSPQ